MAAETKSRVNGNASVRRGSKTVTIETEVREFTEVKDSRPGQKLCSKRWILAYLCLCSSTLVFSLRQSLSGALVCMDIKDLARMTSLNDTFNASSGVAPSLANVSTVGVQPYIPQELRGVFLSCLYYGSLPASMAAGLLVNRFGSKMVTAFSLAASGLLSILLPLTIRSSVNLAFVVRSMQGLVTGMILTSNQVFWAIWAPASEKAQLMSLASQGANLGLITGNALSGLLCNVPLDDGWPLIFYTYGIFIFLSLLVWLPCVYDTPTAHPRIKERELVFIRRGTSASMQKPREEKSPWRAMLTSGPVWAVFVGHACHVWVVVFISIYLPMYMNDVLKYSIAENGLLTSVPFVGRLLGSLVFAYVSDVCSQRKCLSLRANRVIFHCIGTLSASAGFVALSFLGEKDRVLANAILIILVTLQSSTQGSYRVNHLDIAPRYSSSILSVSFTLSAVASLLVPMTTSAMIQKGTQADWQRVFMVNAAISLFNFLFFSFCSSASEQAWAIPPDISSAGLKGTAVAMTTSGDTRAAVADAGKPSDAAAGNGGSPPMAVVSPALCPLPPPAPLGEERKNGEVRSLTAFSTAVAAEPPTGALNERSEVDESACATTTNHSLLSQTPMAEGQINKGFDNGDDLELQRSTEEDADVYDTRL